LIVEKKLNKIFDARFNQEDSEEPDGGEIRETFSRGTSAFSLINYDQIYLATKSNYYRLNSDNIDKLTENLLYRNSLLNQELEALYPNQNDIARAKYDQESTRLFDKCIQNSIDSEFILKILWHRIYVDLIVMRFISMRYSNYSNNLSAIGSSNANKPNSNQPKLVNQNNELANDSIPFFPFI
jgi:hypothetical protein